MPTVLEKPDFRSNDENPKRNDDCHIAIPGFKYDGSGQTLARLLVSVALFVCGVGTATLLAWHERERNYDNVMLVDTITTIACINLLEPAEKREFRLNGRYCGSTRSAERIRERLNQ